MENDLPLLSLGYLQFCLFCTRYWMSLFDNRDGHVARSSHKSSVTENISVTSVCFFVVSLSLLSVLPSFITIPSWALFSPFICVSLPSVALSLWGPLAGKKNFLLLLHICVIRHFSEAFVFCIQLQTNVSFFNRTSKNYHVYIVYIQCLHTIVRCKSYERSPEMLVGNRIINPVYLED